MLSVWPPYIQGAELLPEHHFCATPPIVQEELEFQLGSQYVDAIVPGQSSNRGWRCRSKLTDGSELSRGVCEQTREILDSMSHVVLPASPGRMAKSAISSVFGLSGSQEVQTWGASKQEVPCPESLEANAMILS